MVKTLNRRGFLGWIWLDLVFENLESRELAA